MPEARRTDFNRKDGTGQPTSRPEYAKRPTADQVSRLMHLREIEQELGLTSYHVYRAVHEGRLHPLQRDQKGRMYYAEWEVREVLSLLYRTLDSAAA